MREKHRLVLVEGQNKVDKTRKALETITIWDGDPVTSERARKTAEHYIDDDKTSQKAGGRALTFVTTTRITDSQHETLLQILNENEFDVLLYSSDKARTQLIKDALDAGVNVHDVKTGAMLTTHTPGTVRDKTLDAIREHYRTERITELGLKWDGGRPPIGFRATNGELVEVQWFDQIQAVLNAAKNGDITQAEAAEELDCTRKTIRTALDNPERYNLD